MPHLFLSRTYAKQKNQSKRRALFLDPQTLAALIPLALAFLYYAHWQTNCQSHPPLRAPLTHLSPHPTALDPPTPAPLLWGTAQRPQAELCLCALSASDWPPFKILASEGSISFSVRSPANKGCISRASAENRSQHRHSAVAPSMRSLTRAWGPAVPTSQSSKAPAPTLL